MWWNLTGGVPEFKDKEGKWFNYIDSKERSVLLDSDLSEFSVQGLGIATSVEGDTPDTATVTLTLAGDNINDPSNPGGIGNPDDDE